MAVAGVLLGAWAFYPALWASLPGWQRDLAVAEAEDTGGATDDEDDALDDADAGADAAAAPYISELRRIFKRRQKATRRLPVHQGFSMQLCTDCALSFCLAPTTELPAARACSPITASGPPRAAPPADPAAAAPAAARAPAAAPRPKRPSPVRKRVLAPPPAGMGGTADPWTADPWKVRAAAAPLRGCARADAPAHADAPPARRCWWQAVDELGESDDLLGMLKRKKAKAAADGRMHERVASEVDDLMDNGVRVNPLLRAAFGLPAVGEAAAAAAAAAAAEEEEEEDDEAVPAEDEQVAAAQLIAFAQFR